MLTANHIVFSSLKEEEVEGTKYDVGEERLMGLA